MSRARLIATLTCVALASALIVASFTGRALPNTAWMLGERWAAGFCDSLIFVEHYFGELNDRFNRTPPEPTGCSRWRPDAQQTNWTVVTGGFGSRTSATWAYSIPAWWPALFFAAAAAGLVLSRRRRDAPPPPNGRAAPLESPAASR